MSITPYYQDDQVTLYHGDMRKLLPAVMFKADACVTDPPYGETSLEWDRWVDGWPAFGRRVHAVDVVLRVDADVRRTVG